MADNYNDVFSMPDPRKFVVVHCDSKAQARRAQLEQTKSNGLVSGLGKLAGIAGTGVVQEGLSAIVKTVGVGGSDWEKLVDGGATGILSTVMGDQATNVLSGLMQKINPGAINKGISQAQIIHGKVTERDFNWRDIPQYVSDFKNLYTIGSSIIDPFLSNASGPDVTHTMCSASPYAMDLISQGAKFKFLFVVEFKFYPEYANLLAVDPSFMVKTTDRPTVTYEYEDVNLYNFRTKIAKKSTFTPISMSFHDDEQNRAVSFYNALQRLMTPLTNAILPASYETSGMEFADVYVPSTGRDSPTQGTPINDHAASIGPLLGDCTSIIEAINVYHVYFGGAKMNQYTFHKPKILNMSLDGMDMSSEQITELKMEFAYDNVEIRNAMPVGTISGKDKEDGSLYPLGRANMGTATYAPTSEVPTTVNFSDSTGGFSLAEQIANGGGFVEGLVTSAKTTLTSGVGNTDTKMTSTGAWINSTEGATTFAAPDGPGIVVGQSTASSTTSNQADYWAARETELQSGLT